MLDEADEQVSRGVDCKVVMMHVMCVEHDNIYDAWLAYPSTKGATTAQEWRQVSPMLKVPTALVVGENPADFQMVAFHLNDSEGNLECDVTLTYICCTSLETHRRRLGTRLY